MSIDPGKTVGIAYWKMDGTIVYQGEMHVDDFIARCSRLDKFSDLKVIVYEDYTLRPNKAFAQRGSKLQASQVIGALKLLAKQTGAKLVRQQPDKLRITAMHAGIELPKGHIKDSMSAYLHGYHYFVRNEILKPKRQSTLR